MCCELNAKPNSDSVCRIAPNEAGDLVFTGLPANATLPATIAKADYTFGVADRNPLFVGIFYLALSLIIVGVGFLKSNISSMVGQLYPQGDPRRDPGYTLYYYGSIWVRSGPAHCAACSGRPWDGGQASGLPVSACCSDGSSSRANVLCSGRPGRSSYPQASATRRSRRSWSPR